MRTLVLGAAAAAALSLGACASTEKVLSEPVADTFHSTQSPTEVAFCLGNKNNIPVLDRPDGSKVALIKNGYGGVSMAFSIYPEGAGSRIEWRKKFGTIGGVWKQCVGAKPAKS